MPTIEFTLNDFQKLVGEKITLEKLKKDIIFAKGEIESVEDGKIKADIKDTNRPDLWSVEGVARCLRDHYSRSNSYKIKKSGVLLKKSKDVEKVRSTIAAAVVRNVKLDDEGIKQLIQLQEKVSQTFGRNRDQAAIGVYDFDKVVPPVYYKIVKKDEIKFVPLGFQEEMTPKEIMEKHPKGIEFRHLLKGDNYPLLIDSEGNVLSMPPIINSNHTGKITESTRNLFIEVTGHDMEIVHTALIVMALAIADRGGWMESVSIDGKIETPDLKYRKIYMNPDYCKKISGLDLSDLEITKLLKKAGCLAKKSGKKMVVEYPPWRQDVMHERDIIEDVIINYGFDKIEPEAPMLVTSGSLLENHKFIQDVTELMIGIGFQETISYVLTNKHYLFERMNKKDDSIVEIENPVSASWSVMRNWLLPSLMEFLSNNRHREFPQKIFEIGKCVVLDEKQETKTRDDEKLAAAISNSLVSYEEMVSILDALLRSLGIKYKLKRTEHSSFIEGRAAHIIINEKTAGIVGEINPLVLEHWGLENPVVALELDLGMLKK